MRWRSLLGRGNAAVGRATGYALTRVDTAPSGRPIAVSRRSRNGQRRRRKPAPREGLGHGVERLVERPIFIICSVRSGSTLLRSILGAHSQIHATHELHLRYVRVDLFTDLAERAMRELGLDAHGVEHLLWDRLLHLELTRSGKRLIVEKTPSNAGIHKRLKQFWPQARFIFLLRHPLTIAQSYADTHPDKPFDDSVQNVLRYMNPVQQARKNLDGVTVRYEDLTAQPATEIKRLCSYLEVPWEPGMENYGAEAKYVRGLGDWKDKIKTGSIQPARPTPPPEDVPEALVPLSKAWGYM